MKIRRGRRRPFGHSRLASRGGLLCPRPRRLGVELLEDRRLLNGTMEEQAIELFSISPALFVENQGQWEDDSVRYAHLGSGANVLFTDTGLVFQLFQRETAEEADEGWPGQSPAVPRRFDPLAEAEEVVSRVAEFAVSFEGVNLVEPVGMDRAETVYNYYLGDESNWRTDVPTYQRMAHQDLYDGIDLYAWGKRSSLKYEFHVAPGADYKQIQICYHGVEGLYLGESGALHVQTAAGELVDDAPYIYQQIDGKELPIAGKFELLDAQSYGFDVTGPYDPNQELIIDPDLAWATYLGGSQGEASSGITVDASGNVLLTGMSDSLDFPGLNNTPSGHHKAFVAKLTAAGSLVWATYLGGSEGEEGHGIAVDASGNTLVVGSTWSSDFAGANNTLNGFVDAFVAKLTAGGSLVWATYLGGSGFDDGLGVAVDAYGNALVMGSAKSSDFAGANNTRKGNWDAFVAKVTAAGSLDWATYLGGSLIEQGYGIAADAYGNALVTGETQSADFPRANNALKGGGLDAFVAKLSTAGSLVWATFLGGSEWETGLGVAVDASGNALVTGMTNSSDFQGAINWHKEGGDAFVAKLTAAGALAWAAYLGGSNGDDGRGIAVDASGNVLVTGETWSAFDFEGADNTLEGDTDAFVAKLTAGGSLAWATFLGGSGDEAASGIAVDASGNPLVTGNTTSSDFEGANNTYHGDEFGDAFVAKIGIGGGGVLPDLAIAPANINILPWGEVTATVDNISSVAASNVPVRFRDLDTGIVVGTETIPSIGMQASEDVSVWWTPSGPDARIEVTVDPFDEIKELSNQGNTAVAVYDDAGGAPIVDLVTAHWDADGDPAAFGRFLGDVSLWNTFTAAVIDPDGAANIDRVEFTLGPLGTTTDANSSGGWTADFDVGQLSSDTTLTVTAYDAEGNASGPWTGTVHAVPFPAWLGTPGGDDYFADGQYHLHGFFPEQLQITHTTPNDWWIIGGRTSGFRLGVDLGLVAPLDPAHDLPITHEFVFEVKILDQQIFGYGHQPFNFELGEGVTLSFSGLANGNDLSLAGLSGSLQITDLSPFPDGRYSVPELSYTVWVPVGPIPIPIRVALGMNFGLELDAELDFGLNLADGTIEVLPGTYFEPSVSAEPYIFGGLGIDWLNIGLEAGGELGLHYRGQYDSAAGYSDYSWGTFQINLRAVATVGEKYTLFTWTIPGDQPWSFGDVPPGGMMAAAMSDGDPVVLPWPNVAADAAGNVLLARVVDADPAADQIDPEIAYALRDPGGSWPALNPVASNDLIESDPDAAFDGQGGAVVAWVLNTIDPALVESTDWDVYLETQEIYSSYFDGTSWSVPQVVTSDALMDGSPEVAFHDGQGLLLWDHAAGTGSMDLDGFEIHYALWDDTAHTWGTPVPLTTDDDQGDWSPTVALGPAGEAMAVWVHDDDGDPTTATLHYATWDGAAWSVPAAVPLGSTDGVREPRIAYTSTGDALLAWVGNEGGADILYNSTWDHAAESWAAPEVIPDTPGVIEGLDLDVSAADEAALVWHGWDGQNDLFSTARNLATPDPWAPPARITHNLDGEWMASTAFDSAGAAVTVWANEDATTVFGDGAEGIDVVPAPNLSAENIEVMACAQVEGEEARLTLDVANLGLAPAAATAIEFYLGDPGAGGTIIGDSVDLSALVPGDSVFLVSDIFALPPGTNDYYAVVTPDPEETLTDDNSIHTTVESAPPDVTGPQVTVGLPVYGKVPTGESVLNLSFDEPVVSLAETHISLVEDSLGIRPPDHVCLSAERTSGTLIFEGGLAEGAYTLKVLDSVPDLVGNALDGDGDGSPGGDFVCTFEVGPAVVGRHIFYNNSSFDDPDQGFDDDHAVATDKQPLWLPGETATFANYTSYSRGINGIMIDIAGLPPGTPTTDDFELLVGGVGPFDPGPEGWTTAAPNPSGITVRPGDGDNESHRVTLIWADNAIERQWLKVTVLPTENTGLGAPEVFYFGNAVGESGNSAANTHVNGTDFAGARDNPRNALGRAPIDFSYDYNRDSLVDRTDMAIARDNNTNFLSALNLITVPAGGGAGMMSTITTFPDPAPILASDPAVPAVKLAIDEIDDDDIDEIDDMDEIDDIDDIDDIDEIDELDAAAGEFADLSPQLTLLAAVAAVDAVDAGPAGNEVLHFGNVFTELDNSLGGTLVDGTASVLSGAGQASLKAVSAVFESLGSSPADETLSAAAIRPDRQSRLVVSEALLPDLDEQLLEDLAADMPNIGTVLDLV